MPKIITVAVLLLGLATAAAAQTINVTGTGEVQVAPDMARIQIGVTKEADKADEAMSEMSAELAKVFAALADAGIAEDAMQTSGVRLDVRYNYNSSQNNTPRITGYIASSNIRIDVLDLGQLGPLLDAVVGAGVTQINSLQFDVQDPAPHLEEARKRAVRDGYSKAEIFAEAAFVELGALEELTERGAVATPMRMEASLARDSGVPIAPGQITFSANVSMRYAAE